VKKYDKDYIKFRIDQLRKDKMIYALESIALTFVIELSYFLLTVIFREKLSIKIAVVAMIIPVSYFMYMCIGNLIRCSKIKKLEKQLK